MHGRVALRALITSLICLYPAASLKFSSNSNWNPNVTQTLPDRLDTAYAALREGANRIKVESRISAGTDSRYSQLFTALANFEHTSKGNDTFNGLALQYFQGQALDPPRLEIRDVLNWGYAAIRWYKAYGDNTFRDAAIKFWETAYHYTIFNQTSMATFKNFSAPLHCSLGGSSLTLDLQGATFTVRYKFLPLVRNAYPKTKNVTHNDGGLSVYQSAHFALFSALLAESNPSNSTYLLASTKSLNFTLRFLGDLGMAALPDPDVITSMECPPFLLMFPHGTSTAGFVIEALATLGSVAKGDMVATLDQTVTLILERMSASLGWFATGSGVLPNTYRPFYANLTDAEDGDMYFLRGLAAALRSGEKLPADLRDVIKIIMGVHYNAIRNYAAIGKNLYGRSWSTGGSNSSSFDMYNQAAAAQILVDGIDLFDEGDSSSPSALPSSKSRTGTIVGATIGSVVLVAILAIAAFVFIHRHCRRRVAPSSEFTSQTISPFCDEKSGQLLPQVSHWHTKDRFGLPVSPGLRGSGVDSAPITVPIPSTQGTTPLESDEHRGDEAVPGTSIEDGREGIATQMEVAPGFPDLVRAVYQILRERDGSEAPPDYHSNAG